MFATVQEYIQLSLDVFFPVWVRQHSFFFLNIVLLSLRFSAVVMLSDTVSSPVKLQNVLKQTFLVVFLPGNVISLFCVVLIC